MEKIFARDFRIERSNGESIVSCSIDSIGFPERFWFKTGSEHLPEPNCDWAAIGLLYPAMLSRRSLFIEGEVSPMLLDALQGDLQTLLTEYDDALSRVEISATIDSVRKVPKKGVATGFSAGVDSFSTLLLYSNGPLPITHLATFNVGAFGDTATTSEHYEHACRRTEDFAKDFGIGIIRVSSNMDEVFRANQTSLINFQRTHSLRNAAAAHVLQGELDFYLYSSAAPYTDISVSNAKNGASMDTAHLDPILLPLLSSESLTIRSAGAGLSRAAKTIMLADNPSAQKFLDVCVAPLKVRQELSHPNCSRCWKCIRTMATLEAIDRLDDFGRVFDVNFYMANRTTLLRDHLLKKADKGSSVDQEVIELLAARGKPVRRATFMSRTVSKMKYALFR